MSAAAGRPTPRRTASMATARSARLGRARPAWRGIRQPMASERHRGVVYAENRTQAGADLAQRDLGLHRVEEPRHQVVGPPGRPLDGVEGPRRPVSVSAPAERPEPLGLPALDLGTG